MTANLADLEKLAQLKRDGVLTEDEFSGLKATLLSAPDMPVWATQPLLGPLDDDQIIGRLAEYKKYSGIAWIIIGGLQICLLVTAIAGIWNVIAGLSRLSMSKSIAARDPRVPDAVSGVTQLIVLGVVNLCLGAVFGLIMIGVDFYIRDQILTNARLFDGQAPADETYALSPAPVGQRSGTALPIEVHHGSRGKAILFALMSLVFVVCAPFMIQSDETKDQMVGWLCLVLFGFGTLALVGMAIRPQRLILDGEGFMVAGVPFRSPKKVLWTDVTPFFVFALFRSGKLIGYNYLPGRSKPSAIRRLNKELGAEMSLPKLWKGSPDTLVAKLNAYRARALGA